MCAGLKIPQNRNKLILKNTYFVFCRILQYILCRTLQYKLCRTCITYSAEPCSTYSAVPCGTYSVVSCSTYSAVSCSTYSAVSCYSALITILITTTVLWKIWIQRIELSKPQTFLHYFCIIFAVILHEYLRTKIVNH